LSWEARLLLRRHRPRIVAVTGSVGKTTAKDLVATMLEERFEVRRSPANYNANVLVPLAVLGLTHAGRNPLAWIVNAGRGLWRALAPRQPQWLVLEIAAGHPGEIASVTGWLPTDIVVLTRFPEVPAHIEAFGSRERLLEEKSRLLDTLEPTGAVVVNSDDRELTAAAQRIAARRTIVTYGLESAADFRGRRPEPVYDDAGRPLGMRFEVEIDTAVTAVTVRGILGIQHVYAVLAGLAVASEAGVSADAAIAAIAGHEFQPGRMTIRSGIRGSVVIDDAFNSSPVAADHALACLGQLDVAGRRVAVLGEMVDLGDLADEEHRKLGGRAAESSDLVLATGDHAERIVEGALGAGLDGTRVRRLEPTDGPIQAVEEDIRAGDVVLVKGRGLRALVERIATEPASSGRATDGRRR
jgi:UDP-N-acetylmuramoyl-tripeptide--D-alanyl-D-alanine ligase